VFCGGKSWAIWRALQAAATEEKSSECNNKPKITECALRASDSAGAVEANKAAWQHSHADRLSLRRSLLAHQWLTWIEICTRSHHAQNEAEHWCSAVANLGPSGGHCKQQQTGKSQVSSTTSKKSPSALFGPPTQRELRKRTRLLGSTIMPIDFLHRGAH